ncbi:MAG TPA: hypothetical protein VGJ28_02905 [Micromonosporaceae bacterium]
MTALLTLEPRDAGLDIVEPEVEFTDKSNELHELVACVGCCQHGSNIVVATHSATQ